MPIANGNLPLVFQFFLKMRAEILLGERHAGERLPTIPELHQIYGVSEGTIRKGLNLLQKAGLILKKPRLGIHVHEDLSRNTYQLPNYAKIKNLFSSWKHLFISKGWVEPPHRIADFFLNTPNAFQNGKLFQIRRIWLSKKELWHRILCNTYLPKFLNDEIHKYFANDKAILWSMIQSEKYENAEIKTIETIHPWTCDAETAYHLEALEGSPIFQITWKVYSENNQPIWISEDYSTASSIVREMRTTLP